MRLGRHELTPESPPYLVAEVGLNHGGSFERALHLIHLAAEAGADAVKFQAVKADTLVHPDAPVYFQQNGDPAVTQHEFFSRSDHLGRPDYELLAEACQEARVDFLCTPFDLAVVAWLNRLVPAWKIASADITNLPLLRAVLATDKPVLLSTGAATMAEIVQALNTLADPCAFETTLLHCVLAYPTPVAQANLLTIQVLAHQFPNAVIGYSDHTLATPGMETCTFAYLLGARIIEKHFTDDKTEPGNDHYHSMDATDLRLLRQRTEELRVYLGQYAKEVQPIEQQARRMARRGLYAARPIRRGQVFQPEDIAILRPSARLGPEAYDGLLCQPAMQDYAEGDAL